MIISLKNLVFLSTCLLCSSCATEPTPTPASSKSTVSSEEPQSPILENLKIGMPRAEAERILGNPTSVTDTATGTTVVWVFNPGASKAVPPPEPSSNNRLFKQIGSIAATVAGIISPIAGTVTNIGSQVYSVFDSGDEKTTTPEQTGGDETRIVTIEFRDNKVFSIQRARRGGVPSSVNQ